MNYVALFFSHFPPQACQVASSGVPMRSTLIEYIGNGKFHDMELLKHKHKCAEKSFLKKGHQSSKYQYAIISFWQLMIQP